MRMLVSRSSTSNITELSNYIFEPPEQKAYSNNKTRSVLLRDRGAFSSRALSSLAAPSHVEDAASVNSMLLADDDGIVSFTPSRDHHDVHLLHMEGPAASKTSVAFSKAYIDEMNAQASTARHIKPTVMIENVWKVVEDSMQRIVETVTVCQPHTPAAKTGHTRSAHGGRGARHGWTGPYELLPPPHVHQPHNVVPYYLAEAASDESMITHQLSSESYESLSSGDSDELASLRTAGHTEADDMWVNNSTSTTSSSPTNSHHIHGLHHAHPVLSTIAEENASVRDDKENSRAPPPSPRKMMIAEYEQREP